MYSPRLYKYRDSSVLYKPTVHLFGSLSQTHTLLVQTHTNDIFASWGMILHCSLMVGLYIGRYPHNLIFRLDLRRYLQS